MRPINLAIHRLLACLLILTMFAPAMPATAAAPMAAAELYDPLVDSVSAEIYQQTAANLSTYQIDAAFAPAAATPATITGKLNLTFVNSTKATLAELYFRLYPNGEEYGLGGMTIESAAVNGTTVTVTVIDAEATSVSVPLPSPLAPGDGIPVALKFTSTIPTNPPFSYGMFAHDEVTDVYSLAHWMPIVAGYDAEQGWNLESTTTLGDPVYSNAALYDVTLTTPAEFVFVTTGSEISRQTDSGWSSTRYQSGPSRDFVMAGSANYLTDSARAGDTTVRSYYLASESSGGLEALLLAQDAITTFSDLFGLYPYDEFDVVQVDLGNGAAGVEFPGIIFLSGDFYDANSRSRRSIEFASLVAHEVAHQWWYGMVGNNQYYHAFLDEGLTNYAATIFYERQYGLEAAQAQVDLTLALPYLAMLFGEGDQIVDQSTADFGNQERYGTTVYSKGGLGFQAIRQQLGDEMFFAALQAYVESFRFSVATPADLKVIFESTSGQDLDALWHHWFEATEGTSDYSPADLQQLLETYT